MNRWKVAFFTCLVFLILSNLLFVYSIIDQGVSYTYLEVSFDEQLHANEVLGNLIVRGGGNYSQKDFLHLLRQAYPNEFIVEKDNRISMGPNSFEFKYDRLVKVR